VRNDPSGRGEASDRWLLGVFSRAVRDFVRADAVRVLGVAFSALPQILHVTVSAPFFKKIRGVFAPPVRIRVERAQPRDPETRAQRRIDCHSNDERLGATPLLMIRSSQLADEYRVRRAASDVTSLASAAEDRHA